MENETQNQVLTVNQVGSSSLPNKLTSQSQQNRIFLTYMGLNNLYQNQDQQINIYEQNKRDRKQLELLMQTMSNRVYLLNKQQNKTNKKIQETQLQTGQVYMNKYRHESFAKQQEQFNNIAEQFVIQTQEQIFTNRVKKRLQKEQQRLRIVSAKQKECSEIKNQQKIHEQMIQDFKSEMKQQNILKNLQVRQQYFEGNNRIQAYFEARKQQTQDHNYQRAVIEKTKQQNLEKAIKIIETQENQVFDKLHQTFKTEQCITEEFLNAKKMEPQTFLNKTSKTMRRQLSASSLHSREIGNSNICFQSLSNLYNAAKVAGRSNLSNSVSKFKRIPSAFARNFYPKIY